MLMIEPPSPSAIRVPTSAPSRNGVVDQDVDAAQRGVHVVDQSRDLIPAAEVTGAGQGPPPRFLGNLLGDIPARRFVPAGDDHLGAARG
jgi:hypothetical protein